MFIVIDGLDGVGKGVNIDAAKEYFRGCGRRVFDLHEFWADHHVHPQFSECKTKKGVVRKDYVSLNSFDVLISAEPTYVGVGHAIRSEVIAAPKGTYSAKTTAEMYALDRLLLYKRILLPARGAGKIIIQSRSVSTSIAYQPVQAVVQGECFGLDDVLGLEGNVFALKNPPDVLIIPIVQDFDELASRLSVRSKDDGTWFEGVEFQKKLVSGYNDQSHVKKIFEKVGTKVVYVDNGRSIEESKKQTVDVLKSLGL